MNEGLTHEGLDLVKTWVAAHQRVEAARDALARRQSELRDTENALARWMAPPVTKPQPGEKIVIWCGDSLFQLEVGGEVGGTAGEGPRAMRSDRITVRYRGSKFNEIFR
jgi:hypothetical protein